MSDAVYAPIAAPTAGPRNRSDTYGTATTSSPGISAPWTARSARNTGSVEAMATSPVGITSSTAEPTMTRARPMRSESGPCTQAKTATAKTTTVIESPA